MKVKNFERFDFNGVKINGTCYEIIERNEEKRYICEVIDDDIIYRSQDIDLNICIDSLKELFYITKNIKEFNVIHLYN